VGLKDAPKIAFFYRESCRQRGDDFVRMMGVIVVNGGVFKGPLVSELIGCTMSLNTPLGVFRQGMAMKSPFLLSMILMSCTAIMLSKVRDTTARILPSVFVFLIRMSVISIVVGLPLLFCISVFQYYSIFVSKILLSKKIFS
jgi:LytS/YehU family sensor histidine kinase